MGIDRHAYKYIYKAEINDCFRIGGGAWKSQPPLLF